MGHFTYIIVCHVSYSNPGSQLETAIKGWPIQPLITSQLLSIYLLEFKATIHNQRALTTLKDEAGYCFAVHGSHVWDEHRLHPTS